MDGGEDDRNGAGRLHGAVRTARPVRPVPPFDGQCRLPEAHPRTVRGRRNIRGRVGHQRRSVGGYRHGAIHHRTVRARRQSHAAAEPRLLDEGQRRQQPSLRGRSRVPHRCEFRGGAGALPGRRGGRARRSGRGVPHTRTAAGGGELHALPARPRFRHDVPGIQHESGHERRRRAIRAA